MENQIVIDNFNESINRDYKEVSAEVDGDRVFFRVPADTKLNHRAEPFLGIALLEAMVRNVDIKIEDALPLSEKLSGTIPEIQAIYSCWNSNLNKIDIHARIEANESKYENVGCFWSAGVDSSHTLLRNFNEISHLILLIGFEVSGNTSEAKLKTIEKQSNFARSIDKELIPIETNVKEWLQQRKIQWSFAQGLILSSLGSMLNCMKIFIGSSHTYNELFPWGSHPLSDPMWSTESTQVIHYGSGFRRSDKIIDLCSNQKILDNLQVCWNHPHENCGKCAKCIRTMTALYLLGSTSKSLPDLDDFKKLKKLKGAEGYNGKQLEDSIILAKRKNNDEIHRILSRYYKKYQIRQIIFIIDQYVMRNTLRKIYRRIKKSNREPYRVWLM